MRVNIDKNTGHGIHINKKNFFFFRSLFDFAFTLLLQISVTLFCQREDNVLAFRMEFFVINQNIRHIRKENVGVDRLLNGVNVTIKVIYFFYY